MTNSSNALTSTFTVTGWLFGLLALAIGLINTFWGNDPGFGIFIVALSLAFFPPLNALLKEKIGFAIPVVAKWVLAFLIFWLALGVGELFDKIDLMMASF
ncbi:hypothetical protein [Hymenobacter chitinivorans]|uniref:Uncharacterized protein n=1 Tax=Hymenobacter chitinivorans DSM 11115 TaxID=1121954 RepID=A0A2M9BPM8_9BACT|nr:hypothetical protein [Hymenobacter chitinivorans]PJJ59911.1 hypothetical protein CLV45_1333 [Hymenobacter chitinivorans DSM 11115]